MQKNFAHNLRFKSYIERLILTNFRNYDNLTLRLQDTPVILTGRNGAGKTNILEAISLLSPGRGLRKASLKEIERFSQQANIINQQSWGVWSNFINANGDALTIGTGLVKTSQNQEKRIVHFNNKTVDHNFLIEHISILWITPELDRLFVESKQNRRIFLDRIINNFDPQHRQRIQQYEKIMRQRAHLLRIPNKDSQWASILEQQMVELGTAISAMRLHIIEKLNKICIHNPPFPRAQVFFMGDIEEALQNKKALEVEDYFLQQLKNNREIDAQRGLTHFGPHRSDWGVEFYEKSLPAAHCSTGEQKLLLLSVVLAAVQLIIETKEHNPVLLLDEVTAHLDDTYRAALFEMIIHLGIQAWFTGTDKSYFQGLKNTAQFYELEEGQIELQEI